ncbi:uncharacterized protein LOC117344784 [Pecten maximus]|uniref:uncharacterized protein LOC117344784 n=1 Tax=Pecten maximus TaxID=6579 RepID=UPI001458A71C|nr:uncharacterized protein LOC117344784 [Pecten maximus]
MSGSCCRKWLMAAWLLYTGLPYAMSDLFLVASTSRTVVTKVFIFNTNSFSVAAKIKGLKQDSSGLQAASEWDVSISANSFVSIELPSDMNMNATGIYDNHAISVQSYYDIYLLMQSQTSSVGNLIRPQHILLFGLVFYPITPKCLNYNVLHFMAKYTTTIDVVFPSSKPNTLFATFEGSSYYGGDTLVLELLGYATAMVESIEDLTGTIVRANAPIGMFSGCDYNVTQNMHDYRSDWVLGLKDMGRQYVIMAHEVPSFSYEKYVIVSATDNTTVIIYSHDNCDEVLLEHSGDSHVVSLSSINEVVVADKLIVVVHLPYNMAGYHNMYYVMPVSLFNTEYAAPSFNGFQFKVKMTFNNESENFFVLDGQGVTIEVRDHHLTDFIAVGIINDGFSTNSIQHLKTNDGYTFGGYMWSVDINERLFITSLGRKTTRQLTYLAQVSAIRDHLSTEKSSS